MAFKRKKFFLPFMLHFYGHHVNQRCSINNKKFRYSQIFDKMRNQEKKSGLESTRLS